jgi:hypothetical protein
MHTNIRTQQNYKLFKNTILLHVSAINRHPQGDVNTKDYTILKLLILHYFNQEYVNVILAIIRMLLYCWLLFCFYLPNSCQLSHSVSFLTVACWLNSNCVSDSPRVACDIHTFQILYLIWTLHHLGRADEVRRTRRPYRIFINSQLLIQ